MSIKIILTGATGFVGEGVLRTCLEHPEVAEVLMVNRRHFELSHPKLRELLVPDFFTIEDYSHQLPGYDACLFCAGISSVGMNEEKYTRITYDTTLVVANLLSGLNPDMVFSFISGSHTDSSEKGKVMWARVKGKTENALAKIPFKAQYNFRPGGMLPAAGQKNVKAMYVAIVKLLSWFIPKQILTLDEVGQAMINSVLKGYRKQTLEIADIKELARS